MRIFSDSVPRSAVSRVGRLQRGRSLLVAMEVKHNILLLGANLTAGFCIYLTHSALGHLLGPTAYGTIAALLALASTLLIPTHIISTVVTKYGASLSAQQDLPRLNDFIRRLTSTLLPLGIAVMVIFMALSGSISSFLRVGTPSEVLILGVMFAVSFVTPVNVGVLLGQQRFSWYAVLLIIPSLLRFLLAAGLSILGFGISGAIIGIVVADIFTYIISFRPLHNLITGPRAPFGDLHSLWSYSVTTTAVYAIGGVLSSMDVLFAKHFLPVQIAGLYAAMVTAARIVSFASSSMAVVMFPKFAASHKRGGRPLYAVIVTAVSTCVVCIIVEALFFACPFFIMRSMFGAAFMSIAAQLPWYGLAVLVASVAGVFTNYYLSIGRRIVVLPLALCLMVEVASFMIRHGSVGELVQNLMLANSVMLATLLVLFTVYDCRSRSL